MVAASRENMLLKYFSLHVFLRTWKKLVTLSVILLYLLFFCWAANMSPDVEKVIEFTLVKFTEVTPTKRSKSTTSLHQLSIRWSKKSLAQWPFWCLQCLSVVAVACINLSTMWPSTCKCMMALIWDPIISLGMKEKGLHLLSTLSKKQAPLSLFALAVGSTKASHFADLKCSKLSSLRMWRGRWFHKLGTADEKVRSPKVLFSFKLEYFKMTFAWTETVAQQFFYSDQVT